MSEYKSPVVFGEVLFDCFPDGSAVLGGAPFNVAWHLHGFGCAPLMISAVGNDEHGEEVLNKMKQWGMTTAGLQTNNTYPTGQVSVAFTDGEPGYEIVTDQAYDHIELAGIQPHLKSEQHGLLYHGSLITRTAHSKNILNTLITEFNMPTFVDINLRAPWWDEQGIKKAVENARWLKLNQHELALVTGRNVANTKQLNESVQALFESRPKMQLLIITLGSQGAVCLTEQGFVHGEPVPVNNLVDTVGAGDSFSAVMIAGIINQWPIDQSLDRALQFASAVCEMRGATTTDKTMYEEFLKKWQVP